MPPVRRTKSAGKPARKPAPAAKRKPKRRPKRPRKPKVIRAVRPRYTVAASQVAVETPTDVFAVTATGLFTYLQIRGRGFDSAFQVAVSEKVLTTKSWPTPVAVKALRFGRLLVAKFQVSSSSTSPVPVEETGQVDITVTTSGTALPPNFPIVLRNIPSTYIDDIV